MFKRIVIKLSGEALSEDSVNIFDNQKISEIVSDILKVKNKGVEISLVLGGGNILRGRSVSSETDRTKADQIGMLATVINSIYLADMIRQQGGLAVVMTPFKIGTFTLEFSKDLALEYFKKGYIIIFAGGTGHPFFSTDTIPALRAAELSADCVFYAKNVDGVYDKNPSVHSDAKRYKEITYRKIIKDNLVANDLAAMILCEDNNIPSLVFSLKYPNSIVLAAENDERLYEFGTKLLNHNEEDYHVK
ncbi:MAG: UMP kinase [Defluviitaleaceae bacterium]|nr:UMP kinase [Defluviitaleaceae bacterium]